MSFFIRCLGCFGATVGFGLLLGQPRRTLLLSAAMGTAGYILFTLMNMTTVAYFVASLIVGLMCELAARIRKMAATIFLTSSMIPLVPGLGLYRTMRYLSLAQYDLAASAGIDTLMGICAMALAVTFSSLVFSNLRIRPKKSC